METALIRKAKRRIKRFLTTEKEQARVHPESKELIKYRTSGQNYLHFRVGKSNRLRLLKVGSSVKE